MIWCYDNAIVDDLKQSFTDEYGSCAVSIVPPDNIVDIAAQVNDDKIQFPIIAISRESTISVDSSRTNFTALHQGMPVVFDPKRNEYYNEKVIPLDLSYTLVAMSTNTADVDELMRELIFKYTDQYFLTIRVPYESKRKIRFAIRISPDSSIEWYTTTSNYLAEGKLHSAGISLRIDGAVMMTYTPVKLRRLEVEIDPSKVPHVDTFYASSSTGTGLV